jgi:2-haloacid dehalogenase
MDESAIGALTFDVFGTVVDWRTSVIREGEAFGKPRRLSVDWGKFADAWRGLYQPAMEEVRSGRRPWAKLDELHRESLVRLLGDFGITGVSPAEIDHLNFAWHRLDPWPDAVPGLTRLKRRFTLATLSNGNIALMVDMAKRAGLPWDAILGAMAPRSRAPTSPPPKRTCAAPRPWASAPSSA